MDDRCGEFESINVLFWKIYLVRVGYVPGGIINLVENFSFNIDFNLNSNFNLDFNFDETGNFCLVFMK